MTLASKLKSKEKKVTKSHVIVQALAGTGKTTTLIEGLIELFGGNSKLTPSPQQQAIWDAIKQSQGIQPTQVGFCAFNVSIAKELQRRVPEGVSAMTIHSLGNRTVVAALGRLTIPKNAEWVVRERVAKVMGIDLENSDQKWSNWATIELVRNIVSHCKKNLMEGTADDVDNIADHHDIDLNGSRSLVIDLVPKVLELCARPQQDKKMDFDDMVWLPTKLRLPVPKYELLMVDESQDLNKAQQALVLKAGRRLIFVGDVHQAIYGFAGADAESMENLKAELSASDAGCQLLPLTVTRRCGKAIVAEAQRIVPSFEAHESNGMGKVSHAAYKGDERPPVRDLINEADGKVIGSIQTGPGHSCYVDHVNDGDMIICRVNAPLVSQCFRFLKQGRKATIQGKDMIAGLISTIKKMKAKSIPDLIEKLDKWFHMEEEKELKKRNPSEARLIALQDRVDCIHVFASNVESIPEMIKKIENTFVDDPNVKGIKLSSVHKAKGLESDRVFFLMPANAPCPHPMAKTDWAIKQEYNLLYVGITRAIKELIYVK